MSLTAIERTRLLRATSLDELYQKAGWSSEDGPTCDRQLAEFVFRNLQGSDYAVAGYESMEDALTGDIAMIRRFARTQDSSVHLYAVLEPPGLRAFMLWYSLGAGGFELLPPPGQLQRALPRGTSLRDIAYGDWLIVDASSRVRGLGGCCSRSCSTTWHAAGTASGTAAPSCRTTASSTSGCTSGRGVHT